MDLFHGRPAVLDARDRGAEEASVNARSQENGKQPYDVVQSKGDEGVPYLQRPAKKTLAIIQLRQCWHPEV